MQRRSREIGTFSIAVVDLFASAMGAFILISIILFPYYLKNEDVVRELRKLKSEIAEQTRKAAAAGARAKAAAARTAAAKADADKARKEADAAKRKLAGPMRLPAGDKSLAFAKGCWRTDPFRHGAGVAPGISQYCFDKNGRGNLYFWRPSVGTVCAAPATIRRQGGQILIDDSDSRCSIGQRDIGPWWADHLVCRPDARGVIRCTGKSSSGSTWRVRLYRQ